MNRDFLRRSAFLVIAIALTVIPQQVFACGSCYGDPHSSQTQGMNAAIMSMLGITTTLFFAMSTIFFLLKRKVRIMQAQAKVSRREGEE